MELFGVFMVLMFAVIPLVGFGYVVAYKQQRTLITHWDDAKLGDPKAAAALLGKSMIWTGVLLLLSTVLFLTNVLPAGSAGVLFLVISLLPLAVYLYVRRAYAH